MTKKYLVIGFIEEIYIIDELEADSKKEAIKKTKLDTEEGFVIEEEKFDEFIKNKKRIRRNCQIDVGQLNKETNQIEFDVK